MSTAFLPQKMSTATVSIHSRALSNIRVRCLLRNKNVRGHETCKKKLKFVSCGLMSRVANFSENVTDRYKEAESGTREEVAEKHRKLGLQGSWTDLILLLSWESILTTNFLFSWLSFPLIGRFSVLHDINYTFSS